MSGKLFTTKLQLQPFLVEPGLQSGTIIGICKPPRLLFTMVFIPATASRPGQLPKLASDGNPLSSVSQQLGIPASTSMPTSPLVIFCHFLRCCLCGVGTEPELPACQEGTLSSVSFLASKNIFILRHISSPLPIKTP